MAIGLKAAGKWQLGGCEQMMLAAVAV